MAFYAIYLYIICSNINIYNKTNNILDALRLLVAGIHVALDDREPLDLPLALAACNIEAISAERQSSTERAAQS